MMYLPNEDIEIDAKESLDQENNHGCEFFSEAIQINLYDTDGQIPFWPLSPTRNLIARNESIISFVDIDVGVDMTSVIRGDFRDKVNIDEQSTKIHIQQDLKAIDLEDWEYPGWGTVIHRNIPAATLPKLHGRHNLDVLRCTAIAGNDLLASVLYTTGLVCSTSGQLAPIAVLLCCAALYPYRKIFQECGTALPLNGGVYVALLNSASKFTATFAASCSLISYTGTAVVCAASCTSYAHGEFGNFPVVPVTIGVLAVFGFLVITGVKDSATVALVIFTCHVISLTVLIIVSIVHICLTNGDMFHQNLQSPLPIHKDGGIGMDLFLGFSIGLLGLTGFETSANFIEEAGPFECSYTSSQRARSETGVESLSTTIPEGGVGTPVTDSNNRRGTVGEGHGIDDGLRNTHNNGNLHTFEPTTRKKSVFEKSITNLYWLAILFNPTITLLSLGVLDLETIRAHQSNVLSLVGGRAGGLWLRRWVAIDAILVLSGGVLTAFVGVSGLIKQLASDRCLPSFLLNKNEKFNTNHWIIIGFFLLCTTLYLVTDGDVSVISGVFAIAFLMVLIMFALANMRLKYGRPRLPRGVSIGWPLLILGFSVMVLGVLGNIIINPIYFLYFGMYLLFFFSVIVVTFARMKIIKVLLYFVRQFSILERNYAEYLRQTLIKMKKLTVVFFANTSELHVLNKALLYARDNELCDRVIIAHVYNPDNDTSRELRKRLEENLNILDHIYPKMKVDLLLLASEEFNPQLVSYLSEVLKIRPSFMFIRCPGEGFRFNIGEFDGVRTIMK